MNFSPILPIEPISLEEVGAKVWYASRPSACRLAIVGLGDVGGSLAQALCTLGSESIAALMLFDLDPNRQARYVLELGQIYGPYAKPIPVTACTADEIFDADVVVFTASKSVPPVGAAVKDMRMVQLEANAQLVRDLVAKGVARNFRGLYAIVSDPVDLLCQVARDTLVALGQPEGASIRVKGFGLGVMNARAHYYACELGCPEYAIEGRAYGPHGKDLVVINSLGDAFDPEMSLKLREAVVTANLKVRDLGFKPYIAPAISSAAYSLKACLEGVWHYSTVPFGQQYLGCLNAFVGEGPVMEALPEHPVMRGWIQAALAAMEADYATLPPL